jgi:4-diphosphocytidyl-2-C-methyl-D-erythritol kinase
VQRLTAPAKLTLSLRVVGKRADGYHLLDADMACIDLCDELEFRPGTGLEVVDEMIGGAGLGGLDGGPSNLVARALAVVGRHSAVRLVKRIPIGAGLGGGSADAAAVLRWAGCTDMAAAARLGADVPFCVVGGRARVQGAGEEMITLPFEERRFLIVLPPVSVDTGAAYRAWDVGARGPAGGEGPNDLERAALAVAPELTVWRDAFAGAAGSRPVLAGSGAAWFVEDEQGALAARLGHRLVLSAGVTAPLVSVRTLPPFGPGPSGPGP